MAHRSEIMMDITSANAVITLQAEEILPTPQILQNFSTDQSIATDEMTFAEGRVGIDGGFAVGFTPAATTLTLTLEANSPSQPLLFTLAEAMRANRRTYKCSMTCEVESMKVRYIWEEGCLMSGAVLPNPKKVLEPTSWKFMFASTRSEPM